MQEYRRRSLTHPTVIDNNGHEYIDLGLPSGLLWAKFNVGTNPTYSYTELGAEYENHSFYRWSDTSPMYEYDSDYKYYNMKDGIKDPLPYEYDAARVVMGGSWRMPKEEEFLELFDNCTKAYIKDDWISIHYDSYHGSGYAYAVKYIGPNGKSIIFPCYDTFSYETDGYPVYEDEGWYWTSNLDPHSGGNDTRQATCCFIDPRPYDSDTIMTQSKEYGLCVRGVLEKGD